MAKKKRTKLVEDKDYSDTVKRVERMYKAIKSRLQKVRYEGRAKVAGTLGQEYMKASDEYQKVAGEIRGQVNALEAKLSEEFGLEVLRDKRDELAEKVYKEFKRQEEKFEKIAVRVYSGKNPDKIIDALLALAEEVGIVDPLPPNNGTTLVGGGKMVDDNGIPF